MKQEFLIKLTPYQEAFYNEWKVNRSENNVPVILDQTISGPLDLVRLNSSLVRFINHNLLVNSIMIHRSDGIFWQSMPLLSENAGIIMECDPEDLSELIQQPFDLENNRPARFYLARLNDRQYRIVYVFSPVLIDRLTDDFLCRELANYYNNPEYGHPVSIGEQARLLLELNTELSEILRSGKKRISDFWKKHVRGIESTGLAFLKSSGKNPYDNRVEVSGQSLQELSIECSEELYSKVKRLADTYKMTPYAYGQMVLAILLHRISGVGKLAISYPVSIKKQQEGIFGSYVNTIAKAYYFTEETRLRDLINQNIEYVYNLWDIKADYLPLTDLIGYAPESDILEFTFSQTHTKDDFIDYKDADDIVVNHHLSPSSSHQFIIEQEIKSGVLSYKIKYNSQNFDHELVSGFGAMYKNLYVSILDDLLHNKINYLISGYHLLDYEKHHQVVHSWNDTARPYNRAITLHGLFESQVVNSPDAIALVSGDTHLSYQSLNEKSNQLAHHLLKKHNIKKDELIPICFNRSEHMLIGILGVLKAGGAYVPMDPGYPSERMEHIIVDTGARLVLGEGDSLDTLYQYQSPTRKRDFDIINVTDPETITILNECSKDNPVTGTGPGDLAYVIYTSGTTGQPKGVMIEHSGVVNLVEFMSESHRFSSYKNVGCYSNYVFDAFVNEVFPVLCHGNTLWLFSSALRTSVDDLNRYIRDHDIEVSFIPPVLLKDLLPDTTLKLIFAGGESFPDIDTALYGDITLLNEYGPTETTVCATSHHYHSDGNCRNIGRAIANTTVYVLDPYLRPVPVGASGELYVGGAGVSRGYLNLRELTEERFLVNPFQSEDEKALGYNSRIYKTGDVVRFLPNGDLEYIGRNDSQVKIRGYRIEPGEIEAGLLQYAGIRQALVMARKNSHGLQYLAGYYVSDTALNGDDISSHLLTTLPDYMIPQAYVHLTALPVTLSGKIDRKALPEPLFTGESEYAAPQTPLQCDLQRIYGEVLGLAPDHIGIHDDFFRLGGNSIMSIKLISRIHHQLGMKVTTMMALSCTSIATLSHALEELLHDQQEYGISPVSVNHPADQHLSFGQERLWFMQRYKEENIMYHIPMTFKLDKNVVPSLLEPSFSMLMERHEVLRTLIHTGADGSGYQHVSDLTLDVVMDEVETPEDFRHILHQEMHEAFDLEKELSMRVKLIKYLDDYYLSVVIHHIAFDGWSMEVLFSELNTIYKALSRGGLPQLPDLTFQYKDFALWQRDYLQGEQLEKHLEYWKGELSDFETLHLPLDYKRPSGICHQGKTIRFSLPSDLSSGLRSLSKDLGVSVYSVLLSGYYLMLSSYSGQDDIVIGTPVANRHHPGLDGMIGYFANTMVLRQTLDFGLEIKDFITGVSKTVMEAQIHQDLPFDKLVSALGTTHDASRHPIFQVMFGVQDFSPQNINLYDEDSFLNPFDSGLTNEAAQFDLTTMIDDHGEQICGTFNYAVSLMKESTIQQMISTYGCILEQISTLHTHGAASARLSDLRLVREDELFSDVNKTYRGYDHKATLHSLFEDQAFRTPDHIALVSGEVRLSYRALNEKSNQLAHYLIQQYDIRPGELIPICFDRSENMLIAMLGVLKAGGAYVPMDPGYPMERLAHILVDTNAGIVVGEESTLNRLYEYQSSVRVLDFDMISLDDPQIQYAVSKCYTDNPVTQTMSHDLAYVIYTSGTTGQPKGVMIEHSGVVNLTQEQALIFDLEEVRYRSEQKNVLWYANYVFDAHVWDIYSALSLGHTVHLLSKAGQSDLGILQQYIVDHNIKIATIPPVLLDRQHLLALDKLILAGDITRPELMEYYDSHGVEVINAYGPTETTVCATCHYYHQDGNSLNIGRPIGNTSVYVLDAYLRPVPVGAVGELYVGGAGISRGYLNLPELTLERFLKNPFQTEQEKASDHNSRIYKTGDLVRFLSNGDLEYIGRNDSQVKIRGYRIEPGEIETALEYCEGIRQAVVLPKKNSHGLQYLAAYYVSDTVLDTDKISLSLQTTLPDYMIPSVYIHLNSLPVTINGKLDRKALPEPVFTGEVDYAAPVNPLQEQLVWIYAEVLGLDPDHISIHDDFFRLGGNSIMSIKLINKLQHNLGKQVELSTIFKYKSIAAQAYAIEHSQSLNDPASKDINIQPRVTQAEDQCLSFAQEGLWFIDQYQEGNHAYNIPMAFRVDTKTDIYLLIEALSIVMDRHEILRSIFQMNPGGEPYQKVTEVLLEPNIHQVSTMEALECELSKEANRIFKLSEEIPLSICIFGLDQECYLSLVFHHIAFDGWSTDIFLKELYQTYQSLVSHQPLLPALAFQYKDFALWQGEYFTQSVLEKQSAYWTSALTDFETLHLPTDYKRPSGVCYEGKSIAFMLPENTSFHLRALSKELGVSLYSVMLSGYYLMLSAYSGQHDIIIGSPFANRHYPGLEEMIGMFVNTLPLREVIDDTMEIRDFILKVSSSVSQAQVHQDLPFKKIVDLLDTEHDASRHPVFQVLFGVGSFGLQQSEHCGENAFLHPFEGSVSYDPAKFDLTTMIDDSGKSLSGTFNFATALFKDSTIDHMISVYLCLLKQLSGVYLSEPVPKKISDLLWMKKEDQEELLSGNPAFSGFDTTATLHSLWERQVSETPDRIALVCEDIKLTYRELNEKSNQLAHYLIKKHNIQPDELIPLCLGRSEQMLIGILGVLKAGGAYVPLDPDYPSERIQHMINDTQTKIIIAEKSTIDRLNGKRIPPVICLDDKDMAHELQGCQNSNPVTHTQSHHLAYVIYTSGTTGQPKGVMIEHQSVVNLMDTVKRVYDCHEEGRFTAYTSYVFDVSVSEFFSALLSGNELHLLNDSVKKDADQISQYLLTHKITHTYLPPVLLAVLPRIEYPSLKAILYAGESCDQETGTYWSGHKKVYNLYGPTETTIYATYKQLQHGEVSDIGRPVDNTTVYVLDKNFRPVPLGAVGELYIGGVGVSRGYLNLAELTRERFLHNPFQSEEEKISGYNSRIYKTGDLVRFLPEGDLEYIGRNDAQVKIRGYRIECGEIETALLQYEGIRQAVVMAIKNSQGLQYLAGYYVSDATISPEKISAYLLNTLPDYMVPSAYIHLTALPLTSGGKLDRKALPQPLFTGESEYTAPQTPLQSELQRIYGEILGLDDRIGIHDDFFRLGGNSIMSIKLISSIHHQLGLKVTTAMVFTCKSIASLSKILEKPTSGNIENESIHPVIVNDPYQQLLSFGQERLWFMENYAESSTYAIPRVFRLEKSVNLYFLHEALSFLIERHEILRTLIHNGPDGTGYQSLSDQPLILQVEGAQREEDFRQILQQEMTKAFDLMKELPIRVMLLEYQNEYYLSVVIHHIAFDGWSMEIFFRELNSIYQSLHKGKRPELPALAFQYKDFALWQRNLLTGDLLKKQLDYWKKELSDFQAVNLPLDYPRPPRISYEGQTTSFTISSEASSNLRSLSKDIGVSLYSVLLSGYYLMLSAYSGQDDIVVGTPVANRHYPGLEDMIGFFVNTLVLRKNIDFNLTVKDFIMSVSDCVQGGQIHQDLPFEQLVSALGIEQDSSRHPVFQVMFGVQGFNPQHVNLCGEDTVLEPFDSGITNETAQFDLTTIIDDHGEEICGTFNFAVALFRESSIRHMISTYVYILEQFSTLYQQTLSAKLSELQLIRKEELISEQPGETAAITFTDYNRAITLHGLFESQVVKSPDTIALVSGDTHLSYQSLNEKSNQLAHHLLKKHNIRRDELIPICFNRSEHMLIGILGVLKAGGAYVPIDPGYPSERMEHIIVDTGARLVLGEGGSLDTLYQYQSPTRKRDFDIINVTDPETITLLNESSKDNPVTGTGPGDLAYVIYTSGTTGQPKGVMIEHSGVVNLVEFMSESHRFSSYKNVGCYSNYVFDAFVNEVFPVLCHGNTLWLFSSSLRTSVDDLNRYIRDHEIEVSFIPPVLLKDLLPDTTLKLIFAGGESFPDIDTALYGDITLLNEYGPTETTVCATSHPYHSDGNCRNIGRAIANTTVYVLDPYLRPVPVGASGELYVGGAGVSRGYLNLRELTEERFLINPFQSDDEKALGYNSRIYKTGDVVRFLPNGDLEYIGRNDSQVKIRGYRIEPGEIEAGLLQYAGIRQALVMARKNSHGLQYLAGYYVSDTALNGDDISSHLLTMLPDYMIPQAYVHLTALPVTLSGKIDRKALPEPLFTGESEYAAPQTPLQWDLQRIYGEVLGLAPDHIGIHDDFFRLGGNSITANKLVSKIRHETGVQIKIIDVFQEKTIDKLALVITHYKPEYKSIVALNQAENKPNAFLIHPGGAGCEVYQSISGQLNDHYQCYGVESYNLYNEEKIADLHTLATYYLEHIDSIQKESSQEDYVLIGWCLGGQIALEIASILESKGHRKITILMLDTILRAQDQELLRLSSLPSDEDISREFQAPVGSKHFISTKEYLMAEHHIVGQDISGTLQYTRMILLKAMVKGEKEDQRLAAHIHQLACNNVEKITDNQDLLTVYPVDASHQEIIKKEEIIIKMIKEFTNNP